MRNKLSCAIATILGLSAFSAVALDATDANAVAAPASDSLSEIIVTAQRRAQDAQDVPISMQVLTGDALRQLNVSTFEDYIKYVPNVTAAYNGPGTNEIFMRGLSTGSMVLSGSGSQGLWPNVAIYLDEESLQLPSRNLDVYAYDLERIEVLEGPQGTLFGAGAEAGVIRYITKKPKLNVTEGDVKAGYSVTAHGEPSSDGAAMLNIPLIDDHLAARAVIYSDRRGGYIDNVPGKFTRRNTDIGIGYANYPALGGNCPNGLPNNGFCVPPGTASINNYNIAARATNPVTYEGLRAQLVYKINDDWDFLITQSYQSMDAEGVFYQEPNGSNGQPLKPLEVTAFNPSYDKDRFENSAWNLHGKIGDLEAVYTGGYLVRNVDQVSDYTNYSRGTYADYYQCYGPGTGGKAALTSTCFTPSSIWRDQENDTHQQHEIRLSTPDDRRVHGLVGAYYSDAKIIDVTDWNYKSMPACTANSPAGTPGNTGCLSDIGTLPGTTVANPNVRGDTTAYLYDVTRRTKQIASFLSASFDVVPKVLTITAGTRYFRFSNRNVGTTTSSFGCFEQGVPAGGCTAVTNDLDSKGLSDTETGFRSRGNVTWHVTPGIMLYYTFSQGFRPGSFNASGGALHAPGPDGVEQFAVPKSYHSDSLNNNEIGWKTLLFNRHLEFNGSIYQETWKNAQITFFNPGVTGNLFFNTNGQNFTVRGLETSLLGRVGGLTLQGAISFNHSRQTNSPALIDNNPASTNFGKPITEVCGAAGCSPVLNSFGPIGSPTANSPPMSFSARVRYDWDFAGNLPYVQVGASHTGHSYSQAGENPTFVAGDAIASGSLRFENPAYTTYSASLGLVHDHWYADIHGDNLSNSNAATSISSKQFIVIQTPLRPRVIGFSVGYHF